MPVIINLKGKRLPEEVIKELEKELGDSTQEHSYDIIQTQTGYTHKGMRVRLVELLRKDKESTHDYRVFAMLDPTSHQLLAARQLYTDKYNQNAVLGNAWKGEDFQVSESARGQGIGSDCTAHAIHHAVTNGLGIYAGPFSNKEWINFFRKIGFSVGSPPTEAHAGMIEAPSRVRAAVHKDNLGTLKARKGMGNYTSYLLRRKRPLN